MKWKKKNDKNTITKSHSKPQDETQRYGAVVL